MMRSLYFLLLCSGVALAQDPVGAHLFTNQMMHFPGVSSVAINPDGTKIVSGNYDNTSKIWNTVSGNEIATLKGHNQSLWPIDFSPDESKIVSGDEAITVNIWDIETKKIIESFELNHTVKHASFTPSGNSIRLATPAYWVSFPLQEKPVPNVYAFGVESVGLKFTQSDAHYTQQIFQSRRVLLFKNVFAIVYTGEETEAATIKKTMERIGNDSRIREEDVVLIFFSSRGLTSRDYSFILQAADYDPDAPANTTLRYKEYILAYLKIHPSMRILLLDACYSGSGAKCSPDVSKAIIQTPPGWVLLCSSKGTELSDEHPDWTNGTFTHSLKQALHKGNADAN